MGSVFFRKRKNAWGSFDPKCTSSSSWSKKILLRFPRSPLLRNRVFVWGNGENEFEKLVKRAETNARKLNIRLKRPSLSAIDTPVCEENPLGNLYISAAGQVSPCVYLYPPLPSPFKRIFCGKEYWIEKVSFGSIFNDSFSAIWDGEYYVKFRSYFTEREKCFRELYFSLLDSPKAKSSQSNALPEPPEPCKTCHKILGV
jgi:MoaA/NifB/PqqE/SkfB family radical SAM enzyme